MLVYVQTAFATGRMAITAAMEQCKTRDSSVHQSFAFEYPHSGMQHFYSIPKMTGNLSHPHAHTAALAVICFLQAQMPFQQPP
jgi:hypothetical protein